MKLGRRNDQEAPEYPVLPEDFYVMEFVEYDEPVESAYLDKATGEYPWRMRLVFAVKDPEVDERWQGEKASVWVDCDMNALRKQSIYHILYALDPANDPEGGEDLDDYKGKRIRAEVKHTKKGDKTYANIASVKPMRKRTSSNGQSDSGERELVGAGSGKKRSAFDVDSE